jgi:branched-subunit amino acid transport protein
MMKKHLFVFVILLFAVVIPNLLMAQGPPDPSDPLVPIDGGLSLLVAAAVSYGSKKMYDARKK